MGLQIRDDLQMKALTGLSQAQFDSLLPIFSDVYQTTQQKSYEDGVKFGTRRRQPGGWRQREIANHGGEIAVCPLLLQDLSSL